MRNLTLLLAGAAVAAAVVASVPSPGNGAGRHFSPVPSRDTSPGSIAGVPSNIPSAAAQPVTPALPAFRKAASQTRVPPQQRFATREEVFPDGDIEELAVGDQFTIALFPGVSLAARVTGVNRPEPAGRTIVAELPDIPFGRAIISRHGDALYASVFGAGRGEFEIRRNGAGLLVKSITAADELGCSTGNGDTHLVAADGVSDEPSPVLPGLPTDVRRKAATGAVQDVLIVFNDQARVSLGGNAAVPTDDADIRAKIQAAVEAVNVAYADSKVPMTLRAVLVTPIAYVYPTTEELERALDELRGTSDGNIDGIHATRDAVQADIVSLWVESDVGGGYANINLPSNIGLNYAFNVIRARNPTATFVHEIGHNHGCRHMREDYTGSPSGWAPDAFAHFLTVPGGGSFVTVVANESDRTRTGATGRILRFSAPELTYLGSPTGVIGDRNNAATVRATAPLLAAFRGPSDVFPPTLRLKTKRRVKTDRSRLPVRGIARDASGIASVSYRATGIRGVRTARGTDRWTFQVRLKKRRTAVKVFATDVSGLRSRPETLTILRSR